MSGKVVQMRFNLFEVSKINNFSSKEFINFLLATNKEVVVLKTASNGLPLFLIDANNTKHCIEEFKKSKESLLDKLLPFFKNRI